MEKNLNEELEIRKTFLSEYCGRDNGRTAIIYQRSAGVEVDFLLNGEVVQHQPLYEHSRRYAEDACENWVEGII